MGIEFEDKTGQIREPKDFEEARSVFSKRLAGLKFMDDPELMVLGTTILDALKIALIVSRKHHGK